MTKPTRRQTHGLLPGITEWPEVFDRIDSPFALLRGFTGQTMRVEDYVDDGDYVIRAEVPGVDPDKDIEITISGEILQIRAERHQEQREGSRSEFHYGSFTRSLSLPKGVTADDVKATYDKGILTITVPVPQKTETQRVTVQKP